ncbi:MAG: hypothetical protein ACI4PY_09830, partial [Akkermansia muciniphila]
MKLRLPVRLKLAVLAGLRSVAQATLASGFLAVGAVFFSFSAQAEDDPLAVAVEDEDETAVLLDEEASDAALAGAGVAEAALNDSQAAALAEAEQEHAAELGINATSSAVSQAAIAAQDAAVSPAQAAGGSHADSFVIVSVPDAPALTLPAAEGAVAPSLCAEGTADFATSITPVKTASVAVLPQASTSLTLSEDVVVMASSPVAEATQTSSSSAAVADTSSSGGGAVASAGGAGVSSGGGSASYSLTSAAADSSSSSLVITTPTDDTSSDPIAEEVLEDSSTEEISTTSTTLPDSSASTLATTSSTTASASSATARSLPQMKLLGSTEPASVSTFSLSTSVKPTVFTFEGAPASRTDSAYHTAIGVSTSGTVTYSASNQGVGTAYGSYYLVRDLGQAADFGSDGYIKINDGYWKTKTEGGEGGDCTLSTTSAFTITTYVKLTTTSGEQTFFSTGSNNQRGFAFGLKEGKFDFLRKYISHDCLDQDLKLSTDTWYNMTLSYDGDGQATFYLNGQKVGSISITTDSYNSATGDYASIGSSTYESSSNHLNGSMADLRIYSGDATAQAIRNAAGLGILWNGTSANSVWDTTRTNWKGGGSDSLAFTQNDSVVFSATAGEGIATTVTVGEDLTAYGIGVADGSFTLTAETTPHSLSVQEVNVGSSASLTIGTGVTLNGVQEVNVGSSASLTIGTGVTLNVLGGAFITLGSGATASFAGTTEINGDMTVSGGELELSGTITNRGTMANLLVENGGSYKINVSSENALSLDGFYISKNREKAATLTRSSDGSLSLFLRDVTYSDATLVKQGGDDPKTINATLQNVDFTNCEGSGETKFTETVSFSSLNNLGSNLVITGNATITESLSTASTITNSGTVTFESGATVSFDSIEGLEAWYHDSKDTLGTARNSGYLSGRYLIKGGTVVNKTDETVSATCGGNSYELDFSTVAGAVLAAGSASDGVYYISSGDSLLYGDAGNSMADDTTTSIVLNGGTLQLGKNELGKAVGLSQASTLQLNEGTTFAAFSVVASNADSGQIATNGNTLSLSGSGTYTISLDSGNQFTSSSLGSNVQLKTGDDGWKGTITLTGGSSTTLSPHNLSGLFNGSYSVIEMKGVTGWTNMWSGEEAANIKLTDVTDGSTTIYAWTNGAYVSGTSTTQTCTFTGTWSGTGTFCADTGNGTHRQNYTYQGDISGWTGQFLLDKANMTMTLRFADNANKVNAEIKQNKGTLNITAAATGGTTFANAITASSLTATTALTLSAKKEGESYVATTALTGALNASGYAVTIDNAMVALTVTGATTATSFSNAGTANLNGGATIAGVLSNTGTLSLGGTSTVGKIEGAATVSGNLTLTGVDSVYHSGEALVFGDSSTLTLGTGATETNPFIHSDTQSFKVGRISGSILDGSTVAIQGLSGRQTATYSGEGDDAVITINGGPLNLEWDNPSGDVWSTDTTSETVKNWKSGETAEYFYSGDHVTIDAYSVKTSGNLIAGNVTLKNGATLTVAYGSSLTANSMTIGGTTSISGTGSLTVGSVVLNGATLTIGEGTTLTANSMTISGVTTIDNSANTSAYTQTAVSLDDGTSLTLLNTNLTASSSTDRNSGSLTVRGNGTLTLTSMLKDLTIEGGIVVTSTTGSVAPISGTVTVKAGGTYKVGGHDGLGWWNGNSTASIVLEGTGNEASQRAVLDLAGERSTANSILNLNGYATVKNGTWDPFDYNSGQKGGTIVVSGTGNVIESNVNIRFRDNGGVVFDVEDGADIEMRGTFTVTNTGGAVKTLTKKGNGLLTIIGETDNISGNTISVQAGTLKLAGEAGKVGSGAITLSSNAVLELAHTTACTLSNSISSADGATGTTLRVSGSAAETLNETETVNVAVTDIQSGTLTFNGSSASLGAVTVGAGAGLSATGSSQTLNLSAVVENQGTLNLSGVTTLSFTLADVVDSVSGGISYTDQLITDGPNNGFIDKYLVIRNQGNVASMTLPELGGLTVNVNSSNRSVSSATSGLYAAASDSDVGENLKLNNIYVVNEGNVVYNDTTSNSSGNDTVKQLWLTGGTLELAQSDIKSVVGVHVKKDSTVNIGTNRTLKDSQVSSVANGATLTLTGSGTYSLAVGQIGETASLTSGVALATGESGFTGTVLLNKDTTLNGTDLSALTNGSYSSVTMNGVSGTLKSGDISTNLVLEDYKKDSVEQSALAISGGTEKITFSGGISGGGKMEITPVEGTPADITFSGDISEWTGGISGGKGIANLTFTGDATKVHAAVSKMAVSATDILNVFIDASEDRTFTRGISANSLKLIGGDTVKTVSVKGDCVQYLGSVDLKDKNVILQVSGTGTTCLYAYDAELAVGGSSGIDIADNSGKALTTLRTNTQDASSSGGATLSYCMFSYKGTSNKSPKNNLIPRKGL